MRPKNFPSSRPGNSERHSHRSPAALYVTLPSVGIEPGAKQIVAQRSDHYMLEQPGLVIRAIQG